MRYALTLVAWTLATAIAAAIAFVAVLLLAGPHGGWLPRAAEPFVLVLAWIAVIVGPLWAARWAWRRLTRRDRNPGR